MIADLAPVDRRGEAISYWSVAVYSGLAFGPAIGEVVLDAADYDTVWIVSALLALAAGLLALLARETLTDEARAATLAPRRAPAAAATAPRSSPGIVLFLGLCGLAGLHRVRPALRARTIGLDDSRLRVPALRLPHPRGADRRRAAARPARPAARRARSR